MPVMDGYEAAAYLHRLHPAMPLIALTGWPPREQTRDRDSVFHQYLLKPVEVKQLADLLNGGAAWPSALPHHAAGSK